MTTSNVHQGPWVSRAQPITNASEGLGGFDPQFEEVISAVEDRQLPGEGNAGPLEAHLSAPKRLCRRLEQAHAMLGLLLGDGREHFPSLTASLQEAYLSTIADLVAAAAIDRHVAQRQTY
ncbi:hypothetical protein [Lysobacter sp. FW306-1B-D06B]|uniref:hypothetical protein n=1 Tax=Lysobacter sp. FW306-1B-D06B TaxID=3140250 RepID=UPI003140B25B